MTPHRILLAIAAVWVAMWASPAHARELPDLSVDLHAHLFMKPGLGWFFNGSFDEPLVADSWDDRLSSKVNEPTLNASGIGIMVVALFAHPVYRLDVRDAVREQIGAAEAFVKKNRGWAIAKSPAEAERLLLDGKRVLVLSLEGAGGVLESESDLKELIDEKGIRIVTPLHLVDDRYGGVATMNGFQYVANPMSVVDRLLDAHGHDGVEQNQQGLTPLGERLVVELAKRGVWLDMTHSSDEALKTLVPLAEAAGQPLLFTHTSLRRHRPAERQLSDAMLLRVKKSGGIVGLLPSDDSFEVMTPARSLCPTGCSLDACRRGVPALATMYHRIGEVIGYQNVMLGSDFNGGMRHLSASCGTKSELDREAGFFHVGQTRLVWDGLARVGAKVPPLRMTARAFLDAWKRVQPVDLEEGRELPKLPTREETRGPGWMFTLGAGLSSTPTGDAPAAVLRFESLVQKDSGLAYPLEPGFYFAHLDADVAKALTTDDVPYATIGLNALGVRASWLDNQVEAGAARLLVRRNTALDQDVNVAIRALGGRIRTMPGFLKSPGEFNFFIELGLDLLGYKQVTPFSELDVMRGVYLAGGQLGLGATAYPGPGFMLSLQGLLGADITALTSLPVDGFAYQSDIAAGGVFTLGTADGMFRQQVSLIHYLNVVGGLDLSYGDTQLRGTISISF